MHKRRHLRHVALALFCAAIQLTVHAESWRVIHTSTGGSGDRAWVITYEVDFDSIRRSGAIASYQARQKTSYGVRLQAMAADCAKGTRGLAQDGPTYATYPETMGGDEVKAVCGFLDARNNPDTPKSPAPIPATPNPPQFGLPVPLPQSPRVTATGSGFVVGNGQIVTNQHVIEGCTSLSVKFANAHLPVSVVATSPRDDLALLRTPNRLGHPASIRTAAVLGEDVTVAGYPLSGFLSDDLIVTSGQVNSTAGLRNDPGILQISAPVQPGNSGGPLLDRSGQIVGVIVSKLNVDLLSKVTGDIAQNVNFAIKPEILRLFLDANRVVYRSAPLGPRFDGTVLAERARQVALQVLCEN